MTQSTARNNLNGAADALGLVYGHYPNTGSTRTYFNIDQCFSPGGTMGGGFCSTAAVQLQYMAFHTSFDFAHATTGVSFENWSRLHQAVVGTCNGVEVNSGHRTAGGLIGSPTCVVHGGSNGDFHAHMQACPGQSRAVALMMNGGSGTKGNPIQAVDRLMQEVLDAFEAKEAEFEAKQAEELKALIEEHTQSAELLEAESDMNENVMM